MDGSLLDIDRAKIRLGKLKAVYIVLIQSVSTCRYEHYIFVTTYTIVFVISGVQGSYVQQISGY